MTTIKSDLGEQSFPSRTMRTFEVPDTSGGEFEEPVYPPLPASIPQMRDAPPISAYNARKMAERGQMSNQDVKRAEEAMKAARSAKFSPSRLSPAAKKRIGIICGTSRVEREVVIDGESYVLQNLKSKETREALLAASRFDGTIESPFEVRRQLLAYSLCGIGGVDMELFLGEDTLEARLEMLDELPEALLVKLMDEYNKLADEIQQRYFPKTEAEVAEVLEDLKK